MADVSDSVGSGAANAINDVVLVQLMLKTLKDAHQLSYFSPSYLLPYSNETARAIGAFQTANGVVAGTAGAEPQGTVKPGGATWRALQAAFAKAAPPYPTARTGEGIGFAYPAMSAEKLSESLAAIHGAKNLQADFRQKVSQLVQTFYQQTSIVWSMVPGSGGWRSFEDQEGKITDAGYGESVHQYGYAVDLYIANFFWIAPDLHARKLPHDLHGLDTKLKTDLYDARNRVGSSLKLYGTTKAGDLGHLQYFDDESLDSVTSLMALMHAVGPKAMNWKPRFRKPTDYLCDLSLSGDLYFVGTANDIWEQDATRHISPDDLAKALQAKKKKDPQFSASTFLGRAGVPETPGTADITPADIKAVQKMLRAEFDAAASKWTLWKPVYYPNSDRRPLNPVKRSKK